MIPKYLQPGAPVLVRFGADWRPGSVLERNASDVVLSVSGLVRSAWDSRTQRIAVHVSVIRRDVRKG